MPTDVSDSDLRRRPTGGRSASARDRCSPNLLLVDEINRTPPKTQSALLEAMEERQVRSTAPRTPLPDPFIVVATQNPVEYEGTYPAARGAARPLPVQARGRLPDRRAGAGGPCSPRRRPGSPRRPSRGSAPGRGPGDAGRGACRDRGSARRSRGARVHRRARHAPRASRRRSRSASHLVARQWLLHAAKAWAWLSGRPFVTPDEVKAVARSGDASPHPAARRARARGSDGRRSARLDPGDGAHAPMTPR